MFETKIKEVNRLKCPVCRKGFIKRRDPRELNEERLMTGYGEIVGFIRPLNIPFCTCCGKNFQISFDSINFEFIVEEI